MNPLETEVHVSMYTRDCVNVFHPDTGVRTIDSFVARVTDLSSRFVETPGKTCPHCDELIDSKVQFCVSCGKPLIDYDKSNSFKGDMFEILSEIFFGAFVNDPKVGIRDYVPVALTEDYGVDAIGTNVINNQCAIQCKFLGNPTGMIKYDAIARTYAAGRLRHGLTLDHDNSIVLITTAGDVTPACKQVFGTKIRVINREIISMRIDGNDSFWKEAEQRLVATIVKLGA